MDRSDPSFGKLHGRRALLTGVAATGLVASLTRATPAFVSSAEGSLTPVELDPVMAAVAADQDSAFATQLSSTFVEKVIVSGPGIDPTGVSDSTTAVQAKVDEALATGRTLYFPDGKYRLTRDIVVAYTVAQAASFKVEGEFSATAVRPKTIIILDAANIVGFNVSLNDYASEGFEFSNLSFVARGTSSPAYHACAAPLSAELFCLVVTNTTGKSVAVDTFIEYLS